MTLRILFILLFAFGFHQEVQAQKKRKSPSRNSTKAFPKFNYKYNLNTFYVEPGLVLTTPFFGKTLDNNLGIPKSDFKVTPRVGAYIVAGYKRIFKNQGFLTSWDVGLEAGYVSCREKLIENKHTFNYAFIGVNGGLNRIDNLGKLLFIESSLGINVQFIPYKESLIEATYPNFNNTDLLFYGDVHLKVGLGIKILEKFYVVPCVQLPLVNYLNFKDVNPSLNIYNTRHYPMRIGCRFWFLFNKSRTKCPKVENDPFG